MTAASILQREIALRTHHVSREASRIPRFIYGTAWKKAATADLVYEALSSGFTAIDTACQPKHYREDLVGEGVRRAMKELNLKRQDIYIQTKFTSLNGQDPDNVPYDTKASIAEQVKASVEKSLEHLRAPEAENHPNQPSYIDTILLHSPLATIDDTMEAWRTLEEYVAQGRILNLGISNCTLFTLMDVCERATIKPGVLQNRFYPTTKFDIGVRKFCKDNFIIYQSFWTLTANPGLVWSNEVGQLANELNISRQAALYCLILGLPGDNTTILNGTKSTQHMKDDLQALDLARTFAKEKKPEQWNKMLRSFSKLIGEKF